MREILFHGKRIDNGEWVEGFYVCIGKKYHFIFTGMLDITKGYPEFVHNEVDPETVGQWTGLYDNTEWEYLTEKEREDFTIAGNFPSEWKGKKIFAGDIIKITWVAREREPVSHVASVVYKKSGFFTEKDGRLKGQLSNYICDSARMRTEGIFVEIIGTIHDNPELLKEEN